MRLDDNDFPTDLTFDGGGGGGGFGAAVDTLTPRPLATVAEQLTSELPQAPPTRVMDDGSGPSPSVVWQSLADSPSAPTAPAPASSSVTAPAPASVQVAVGSGFFQKMTNALASAQGNVPMGGLRTLPMQAATKLGADTSTASTIGVWTWPIVIVLAIAGTVFAFRRRIFSHKVTA